MAKSKEAAALLEGRSATEGLRITLRSSEPNLKSKAQVPERKEHELGTVVATRLQVLERPNPSFKRTCLRQSA